MYAFDSWELTLYHSGILGMKWGIRRYQNKDGTLTELGKRRYGSAENFNRIQSMNKKPKYMSDEELRRNTERLRAEKEYSELKRGQDRTALASKVIDAYNKHSDRKEAKEQRDLERTKAQTQALQAKYKADEAKAQGYKAKQERKKAKQERKLYETEAKTKEAKTNYLDAKSRRSKQTIRGGLAQRWHDKLAKVNDKKSFKERQLGKEYAEKSLQLKIADIDKRLKEKQLAPST